MQEAILSIFATEQGFYGVTGFISTILSLAVLLIFSARARAGRLGRQVRDLESKVVGLERDLATSIAERRAAAARVEELERIYLPVIEIDKEIAVRRENWRVQESTLRASVEDLQTQTDTLRHSYAGKKEIFDRLNHEAAALEDRLDLADLGMYRPTISLGSTEEYGRAIDSIGEKQKAMIANDEAVVCQTIWRVGDSEAKGRAMIKRNIRLTLRAYNNECQVLVDKVTWKNYDSITTRMQKVRETFNKLNESLNVVITQRYENLKLEELRLVYEEAFKQQEEKDKIREEKEREREEAKAQRELQAEIVRSEKREREREAALAEARSELAAATEAERAKFEARVNDLEDQLRKAHEQTERTKSMAEQTRVGHVYIISNKGSFGEEVFKIGMTRRLEPRDRIRELGDASVPFPFDLHALIFTEDAPTLERELHTAMEDARVNRVNLRKEFFRTSASRVAEIVRSRFPQVVYEEHPASQEYLGSLSLPALKKEVEAEAKVVLPAEI